MSGPSLRACIGRRATSTVGGGSGGTRVGANLDFSCFYSNVVAAGGNGDGADHLVSLAN